MDPQIRAIAKKFGRTPEQAIFNVGMVGLGCAVIAVLPLLLFLLWFVLWIAGLILGLVF